MWIGLQYVNMGNDAGVQPLWTDGSMPEYSRFNAPQADTDSKPCIVYKYSEDSWYTDDCSSTRAFACEFPNGKN